VITPRDVDEIIHVSGHPKREEVIQMLKWLRPHILVPVHGESIQVQHQAELGEELNIPHVLQPQNGTLILLERENPKIVDQLDVGVLAVEPGRLLSSDHKALAERRKLPHVGVAHVSVALDQRGDMVSDPEISLIGLIDEKDKNDKKFLASLYHEIEDLLCDMDRHELQDNDLVSEELRITIRRALFAQLNFKPIVSVHVLRVD